MRRPLALLTLTTSLLVAYVPPATALPSLGDLLYPTDSINDNISKLEGALRDLIEQFGNTVDAQTLKTMQRMLATLQSARLAYADVLNTTLEGIGEQRAALLYDVHNQLLELQKSLAGAGNTLSLTEQRVSSTLLSVSRAKRLPLLLEFDPPLYRPNLATPLQVTVRGQNLGHPENRLQFKGVEYSPAQAQSNDASFLVDRAALVPNSDGFVQLGLRTYQTDESIFRWLPWHRPPEPVDFKLLLRPLGDRVGTYTVESDYPSTASPYLVKDLVRDTWPVNPGTKEVCEYPPEGATFDPAYTQLAFPTNTIFTPARTLSMGFGTIHFPAATAPGPNPPASVSFNSPERICVQSHSSVAEPREHTLVTRLTVRIHYTNPTSLQFLATGPIPWSQDTPVTLPNGYKGFQLTVNFANGETRVFTSATSFGPLAIAFDPNSRTLVLRPQY